jgi:hypothetical protein
MEREGLVTCWLELFTKGIMHLKGESLAFSEMVIGVGVTYWDQKTHA